MSGKKTAFISNKYACGLVGQGTTHRISDAIVTTQTVEWEGVSYCQHPAPVARMRKNCIFLSSPALWTLCF